MTDLTPSEQTLLEYVSGRLPDSETHHRPDEMAAKIIAMVREHDAQVVHATQDPKYSIRNNRLINAERNEDIPMDEPVFLMRARDKLAHHSILDYAERCERMAGRPHVLAVLTRANEFAAFANDHPDRMKYPDTEPTKKLQQSGYSGAFAQQGDVRFVQQNDGPVLSDDDQPG
ncbi:hypothetical protein D3C71_77240 [compost metagenome]